MKKLIIILVFCNIMYSQCDEGVEGNIAEVVWQIDSYEGQGHEEQVIWGLAFNDYIDRYKGKAPDSIYYDRHNRVYGLEWRFKDSIIVIEVDKTIIEWKKEL